MSEIDTAAWRRHYAENGHDYQVEALLDEIDRLRSAVLASYDICDRPGGCIPGRLW